MPTVQEMEDKLSQRRTGKSEECGSSGMCSNWRMEEEGTGRPGCRSKHWAHEDQRDEPCKIREDRDGFSKIREDRDDGFVQGSQRKTCKRFGEDRWDDLRES